MCYYFRLVRHSSNCWYFLWDTHTSWCLFWCGLIINCKCISDLEANWNRGKMMLKGWKDCSTKLVMPYHQRLAVLMLVIFCLTILYEIWINMKKLKILVCIVAVGWSDNFTLFETILKSNRSKLCLVILIWWIHSSSTELRNSMWIILS